MEVPPLGLYSRVATEPLYLMSILFKRSTRPGTKRNFFLIFCQLKGFVDIYKKAIYYFPISYFCFATSQSCILVELRLPTVIRKVKITDFVKRATSPKMQPAEFRFDANSKVHSFL